MKRTLVIAAFAAVACNAFASVNVLTSRPAGTDNLDWGQLGPTVTSVASGSVATTTGTPFLVKVSSDVTMSRIDQSAGWNGDFNPGEKLLTNYDLTTQGFGSYIELLGEKTCIDMGANFQAAYFGGFVARITAYNGLNQMIGSFAVAGNSTPNADGSAMFLGIHSDTGDIHRVVYSLDSANGPGIGINNVTYNCCAPVPEPATMSILGLGAAALLRRKSKKA